MLAANSMNKACQRFEAWGNAQLEPVRIPTGKICFQTVMFGGEAETANSKPVSQPLHASKGTTLPDATIDGHSSVSRCMERTLWGIGLAADMIQGCHPMRRALSRRNPGITEEVGIVAEWQNQRILTSISERSVNWQVINPVQG